MRTTVAVVESVFDHAVREINALEQRVVKAEDDADALLWEQARQVVAQLDAGLSQRQLAAQWINARTGEPYSQSHVRNIVAVVAEYLTTQPRPRFRDAYNEIANAPKVSHNSDKNERDTPTEMIEATDLVEPIEQYEVGHHEHEVSDPQVDRPKPAATFNQVNENIGWARWSWNPVTGCLHNCEYCYARDLAERFYPQKFEPTFLPERLTAPANTRLPSYATDDPAWRRVFTCSMADLFGKWVPQEWIAAVFEQIRSHQEWEFLCLTKFPDRLAELDWPSNVWAGTTVDRQHRVANAERSFRNVKAGVKWLSCEPLLEPLRFTSLEMFDWVVIGASTGSRHAEPFAPPFEWVCDLYTQARAAGCRVYLKHNLFGADDGRKPGMQSVREWPR